MQIWLRFRTTPFFIPFHLCGVLIGEITSSEILLKNFLKFHIPRIVWCIHKRFPLRLLLCDVSFKNLPASTDFPHPYGITIRYDTKFGEGCQVHQHVTIGQRRRDKEPATIGNNVMIGAGATILGPVKIGDGAKIAARAVVLQDVPTGATFVSKYIGVVEWPSPS